MSRWAWEAGKRFECMAVLGSHEVLHHLDFDVRRRPCNGEVIHLYHDPTYCLHEESIGLHRLESARCDMGILLYYFPWNTALLPTSPRNLDSNFDP